MTTTRWERYKSLSDRLRAVWDAHRDGVNTWPQAFEAAREALARSMEMDLRIVREMTWDEFRRLQGWHEPLEREEAGELFLTGPENKAALQPGERQQP